MQVVDLLVDLIGIEPMTSSMPWKRAPSCATGPLQGGTDSIFKEFAGFVNAYGNFPLPARCLSTQSVARHSAAGGELSSITRQMYHSGRNLEGTRQCRRAQQWQMLQAL